MLHKTTILQFIIMPRLMKALRTNEAAYIFYNYKVTYKLLFQISHLQSHFSNSSLVTCHSFTQISFSNYLLIAVEAQFSIFYDVVILLDTHPRTIFSVPSANMNCFPSQFLQTLIFRSHPFVWLCFGSFQMYRKFLERVSKKHPSPSPQE